MADAASGLRAAAQALEDLSDTPRLDAELLMAHALGITREALLLDLPCLPEPDGFATLLERRIAREPVAHIIGEKEFWGLSFRVSGDVLIPRPDSELLIEAAVRIGAQRPPAQILDLGTGSGALLLSALSEFPDARGVGVDASAAALGVAHSNADHLGLSNRVQFQLLDWTEPGWQDPLPAPFDLILANPPYVSTAAELSAEVQEFEPHEALFAGPEGLDDYRILLPGLGNLLGPDGHILLEIGYDQADKLSQLAESHGFLAECLQDLGGNDRLLILTLASG
ncbi:release factor glutamine methyltransferase [Parasphingorhabdus marina DSM 22363]|uniref:Release factor glutamine methyltransferase n=1 Tax=Parasphingorhabdus marina DSM 22363 TaxID=1123272 RepID=A0A1N6CN89_9SPHN|nr:peptide chain release factor N(5)-glutamine methyltransferase [Parasphingorhabdus marina]SIN59966.1 release factor glutamine methyltransferase [Parasphingorhabdus marina DSM 22363]